jgi:acetate kinase
MIPIRTSSLTSGHFLEGVEGSELSRWKYFIQKTHQRVLFLKSYIAQEGFNLPNNWAFSLARIRKENCFTMSKIILSVNAGSSSVKISVYSTTLNEDPLELAEIQIDGLTAPPPELKYTRGGSSICKGLELSPSIKTQNDAFKYMLDHLIQDQDFSAINKKEDIAIVCHRVVHGGDYEWPQEINEDTYHHLEALTDLAPLHNASALEIVKFLIKELPGAKNVAVFDSEFHQTIPEHIRTYPINQEIAKKNKLRKYGFHGISYSFITRSVADFLGKKEEDTNLICLHLGSGASACAVKGGKSWDTSMGLTPLAGLPGATRSGSVDPRCVLIFSPSPPSLISRQ